MREVGNKERSSSSFLRSTLLLTCLAIGTFPLTGCIVAGVSSGGGFFIWPGSIGLLLLILVVVFVLRRR
jgi:hypothetical protein